MREDRSEPLHVYEDGPRCAVSLDLLTATAPGDCIPGCIRVDSAGYPARALLRVPLSGLRRSGCPNVYELWQLVEEVVNGRRVDCAAERAKR